MYRPNKQNMHNNADSELPPTRDSRTKSRHQETPNRKLSPDQQYLAPTRPCQIAPAPCWNLTYQWILHFSVVCLLGAMFQLWRYRQISDVKWSTAVMHQLWCINDATAQSGWLDTSGLVPSSHLWASWWWEPRYPWCGWPQKIMLSHAHGSCYVMLNRGYFICRLKHIAQYRHFTNCSSNRSESKPSFYQRFKQHVKIKTVILQPALTFFKIKIVILTSGPNTFRNQNTHRHFFVMTSFTSIGSTVLYHEEFRFAAKR